jgi:hypothetical protein
MACIAVILALLSLTYTENFSNGLKVCICYFGLSRNALSFGTLESIEENWMKPLNDMGIKPDIYLHTYNLQDLDLKRSNEKCDLNPNEWELLNPNYFSITNQNEFDNSYDIGQIEAYGDGWVADKHHGTQLPNLLRQFNSLKTVTGLLRRKYDVYIYLRPDLLYLNPITPKIIQKVAKYSKPIIASPNWQLWDGLNDRFAVMNREAALLYGNRLDYVLDFCEEKGPLHAETYLKWLMKKYKIRRIPLKIKAQRVRCDGSVNPEKTNAKSNRIRCGI